MNSTKKKGRGGKLILTGALALAMAASPVASYLTVPAMAAENGEDELLYLVNCATTDPTVVPGGYDGMGVCQSNVDQKYGEDSTGYSWGYDEADLTGKKDGSQSAAGSAARICRSPRTGKRCWGHAGKPYTAYNSFWPPAGPGTGHGRPLRPDLPGQILRHRQGSLLFLHDSAQFVRLGGVHGPSVKSQNAMLRQILPDKLPDGGNAFHPHPVQFKAASL